MTALKYIQGDVYMKIKAAIARNVGEELKIEDVELMEPSADEVLIKIVASGVCYTA
jgi:aryl-alcohol dehydrogenase